MAPSNLHHRRTHNLLLISKLLNQRDAASPFTLILDDLEQSGSPLIAEYVTRARAARVEVVFVSFDTLKNGPLAGDADIFIEAWSQNLQEWQRQLSGHLKSDATQRRLIVIDCLNTLASTEAANLPGLLSSFISPTTSLLGVYHTDVPEAPSSSKNNSYAPGPLDLLKYLATTILACHSIHHVLARKAARGRSHVEPSFGLAEDQEGLVQSLGANGSSGLVLELEHRRKSGRGVREWYYFPILPISVPEALGRGKEKVILLEDHPQYRTEDAATKDSAGEGEVESTFELGLTEKQRLDREGVVLPYFDAQKGGGEGGRILYDMGSEDDFDEEEDEI